MKSKTKKTSYSINLLKNINFLVLLQQGERGKGKGERPPSSPRESAVYLVTPGQEAATLRSQHPRVENVDGRGGS